MTHQTFCHYEILEKLGEGGMGIVYRAHDSKLNRLVALKFPSLPPLETGDHVDRFYREARAISALNHPNIATIYDVNEDQGRRFLVLEYLPGGTLRTLLRNWRNAGRKLSLIELLDFALQIADGLAHSHRNGVIHRDIKSDNVMFTAEGALKITDFSMAKCTDGLQLTRTGSVAGTVAYMSPEQAQGLEVDHRSDVFSFGILLYEMATGELPFRGPHEAVVFHDIVHEPTPLVRVLRPDLPETFEAVVQRATAKKPEDRFQKMEELFNALVALREAAGPAGSALRRHTNASMATVALSSRPTLVAKGAPPNRWKKRALTAGAATVLALLLFGVFQWIGGMKFQARMLPEKRQLAVLPFRNIGDDARNQAFIDGLTETLSSKLSQLERFVGPPGQSSLGVVPMSEVRGEKNVTPSEARKRFGVSLVLSGAVQRQGNKVRVSVNLIDTETMRNLNSYVLDTQIEEIYPLQDGIFYQVAEMLGVPLAPQAQEV
ncbi:MAG: serine/threonine-protein kinase, partial [Verrucomicrobiota bacterium]